MIRSMTGFTRVSGSPKEENWSLEIRSLNHRYFELSLKAPAFLYPLEPRVRDKVQHALRRGKISLNISSAGQEENGGPVPVLDEKMVSFYLAAAEQLKKKYAFKDELALKDILQLPRIFTVEKSAADPESLWPGLERLLERGLKAMIKMKETEGRRLASDISSRLEKISRASKKVEKLAAGTSKRYYKTLTDKLEQLLGDKNLDEERLHREAAYLAERSDVTEEMVRLSSHLDLFRERLQSADEVGRELDFLCQEINREINTLGSKAQFFEIATEVIFMKKELEKIREQVQNIE